MPSLRSQRFVVATIFAIAAISLPIWLFAQGVQPANTPKGGGAFAFDPNNPKYGTMHFETSLGSFKLLPKADRAEGRVELTFTGTLLVSQLDGKVTVGGNVRKEYEGHGRQVYFGEGNAIIEGSFRAIQWFGRSMKGKWIGEGTARFFGEFDESLNTGTFHYLDPTQKQQWGTYGMQADLPTRPIYGSGTPIPRKTDE